MTLRLTVNLEPFLLSALMSDLNEVITQSEIRVRPVYSTRNGKDHRIIDNMVVDVGTLFHRV